jgi:hypothetical protein
MDPKLKAKALVLKFSEYSKNSLNDNSVFTPCRNAKECALICCDEVLGDMGADRGYTFWTEVKQELEKL